MQKGQTLIEVVIAVALATIVITALLSTTLSSLNNAEVSQAKNEATQYSRQGLEIFRSMIKIPDVGTYCLGDDKQPIDGNSCTDTPNIGTKYIRKVVVEKANNTCDNSLNKVTVTTYWQEGSCQPSGSYCKKSELESCFSNI